MQLAASGSDLTASGVASVTFAVGPGGGPAFAPIVGQLSPSAGSGWSASVTEVPAGPQRSFDLVAYDAGGTALFRGGAQVDVAPGRTAAISVALQQVAPPSGPEVSNPVVQYLAVSPAIVAPGRAAQLTAQVSAPASGGTLSTSWQASCGTFSDPTQPSTVWTAPTSASDHCTVSFTAANDHASTTVALSIVVQQDNTARDVVGWRLATCWEDPAAGSAMATILSIAAPDVASLAAPAALVETSPGSWVTYAGGHLSADGSFLLGTFSPSGSFIIPQVPATGPFLLSLTDPDGVRWLVETNASTVDLGYDELGRCDPAPAAAGTQVSFAVQGLEPWSASLGELEATCSGAGLWTPVPASGVADGATTATISMTWGAPLALLVPSDSLWLHQLAPVQRPDGVAYRSAVRSGMVTGIALADGAATSLAVNLLPVAQSGSLPVQWSTPDFERNLASMAPASRLVAGRVAPHRLAILASPYSLQSPAPVPSGGWPELATLELPVGAAPLQLSPPLAYGEFLPQSWLELREVRYAASVAYQAPGATTPVYETSTVGSREALPAASALLTPALTPVQSLRIDGADALSDLASPVTTTPTFSWAPPAVGSPSYYVLEIEALSAVASGTVRTTVARVVTRSTQITLPPDILAAGGTYFARVTATASSAPFDSAPFRSSPVVSWADALTGTFTP